MRNSAYKTTATIGANFSITERSTVDSINRKLSSTKNLVLAIVSPYPPSKGTLNEYAFHLIEQFKLKSELKEIHVITDILPDNQIYPSKGRPKNVYIHPIWSFNKLNTTAKIGKTIATIKPDVVLYNLQFLSFGDSKIAATLGLLSPMITKWRGIPSMVLLHNIIETVDYSSAGITESKIMKWVYNAIGKQITNLILSASLVAVTIPKYVRILESKYNCRNVALLPHGSFESAGKPNYDFNPGVRQVLTFGKFGTYKKVENLIEALIQVRKEVPFEIELTIAGTDNPNVKGYLDKVAKQYQDIKGIHFTGYVEEEDVESLFTNTTIVAFDYTSTTGSSGVLHQAGSYGRAVMLPNIGDLRELITEEGYQGEYFTPNNISEMSIAMKKLLLNDEYRKEIGKQNYVAANGLAMSDIAEWYLMHFQKLAK